MRLRTSRWPARHAKPFLAAAALVAGACTLRSSLDLQLLILTVPVYSPDADASKARLPQPNDLALSESALASLPAGAQRELLTAFQSKGGFPNDQALPIVLEVQTQVVEVGSGQRSAEPPRLDPAALAAAVQVVRLPGAVVELAPFAASDWATSTDRGTLTLHNRLVDGKPAPWEPGASYAVLLRGGAQGSQLSGGATLSASPPFFLLTRGGDLTLPAFAPLFAQLLPGPAEARVAQAEQLELVRRSLAPAFRAADSLWAATGGSSLDLAVAAIFTIAPEAGPHALTDLDRGQLPLPCDLLLDPAGRVQGLGALGPLAAGFDTLDGFSTTALVSAPLSGPVDARTVSSGTLFLYDLTDPAHPVRVEDASSASGTWIAQPAVLAEVRPTGGSDGLPGAPSIGLQPAASVGTGDPARPFRALPPLQEATEYAVLVTDGVRTLPDAAGATRPLSRSTLASLLLLPGGHPVAVQGSSTIGGLSDARAVAVQRMRSLLDPAIERLGLDTGLGRERLAIAYTFRTQTTSGAGAVADAVAGLPASQRRPPGVLQLAALPWRHADLVLPAAGFKSYTPAQAWQKWGLDASVPTSSIDEVIHGSFTSLDLLSAQTGTIESAALVALAPPTSTVQFLLVLPEASSTPACAATSTASASSTFAGLRCAPLVIFHHGFGGSKAAALTLASSFASRGFAVAAIDAPKHGDRSWCRTAATCAGGGACVPIAGGAGQGDASFGGTAPGRCAGGVAKLPTACSSAACVADWLAWSTSSTHPDDPPDGLAQGSGDYLFTANLFRTRDTLLQDLVDQSALLLALARPPPPELPAPSASSTALAQHLAARGLALRPGGAQWVGPSLGASVGALALAAIPRLTAGVLGAGGATLIDLLATSPALRPELCAILSGLSPPLAQAYDSATGDCAILDPAGALRLLTLAKWALDPAEALNAAGHLWTNGSRWPDPVASTSTLVAQRPKPVEQQQAACDAAGTGAAAALLGEALSQPPRSLLTTFLNPAAASLTCPLGPVAGTFLTDWGVTVSARDPATHLPLAFSIDPAAASLSRKAQALAAGFLSAPADPASTPPAFVSPEQP